MKTSSIFYTFSVEACQNVKLALSYFDHTSSDTYEVIIGTNNNRVVEIRSSVGGTVEATKTVDNDLLHCSQYK